MLHLKKSVPNGQVIAVPTVDQVTGDGESVWASGWGNVIPSAPTSGYADELQAVQVNVLASPTDPACENWSSEYVGEYHLCAGADWEGTCVGDSGGPLARVSEGSWELAGITSFGSSPAAAGCAAPGFPGIFSRASFYGSWIPMYAEESAWIDLSSTATFVTITDLEPGYRYEARVRGYGASGGDWSEPVAATVEGDIATLSQEQGYSEFLAGDFDGDGVRRGCGVLHI